ncbi:MAG: isoprenylcysteine carboxylmethyltransferase family protein [Actinomycetaceae bacterium]|nr:isoprenylcysteine carboxylmethyltransferase family protein [Actinomycetaceae bacterium]
MRIKNTIIGVGPLLVVGIAATTAATLLGHYYQVLPTFPTPEALETYPALRTVARVLALIVFIEGITLWSYAVIWGKFTTRFRSGELMDTGAYALVRHPIYSAFFSVCSAALIWPANLWAAAVIALNWAIMTVVLKCTEERWCLERFGESYREYCKKTPRLLPRPRAGRR